MDKPKSFSNETKLRPAIKASEIHSTVSSEAMWRVFGFELQHRTPHACRSLSASRAHTLWFMDKPILWSKDVLKTSSPVLTP